MAEYTEEEQTELRASGHWPAQDGTGHELIAGQDPVDPAEYERTGETTPETLTDETQDGMKPAEPQPVG